MGFQRTTIRLNAHLRREQPLQPLLHDLVARALGGRLQPILHLPHAHRVGHARAPGFNLQLTCRARRALVFAERADATPSNRGTGRSPGSGLCARARHAARIGTDGRWRRRKETGGPTGRLTRPSLPNPRSESRRPAKTNPDQRLTLTRVRSRSSYGDSCTQRNRPSVLAAKCQERIRRSLVGSPHWSVGPLAELRRVQGIDGCASSQEMRAEPKYGMR